MILEMAEAIPLAELQFTMNASEDLRMSRRRRYSCHMSHPRDQRA